MREKRETENRRRQAIVNEERRKKGRVSGRRVILFYVLVGDFNDDMVLLQAHDIHIAFHDIVLIFAVENFVDCVVACAGQLN